MCHMKCQVLEVLKPFLSILHTFEKKGHNMLTLMLDPIYKSMHLVMIYVGLNNVTTQIVEYDHELLLPLLMEVYKLSMLVIVEELDASSQGLGMKVCFAPQTKLHTLWGALLEESYTFTIHLVDGDSCKYALTWQHTKEHKCDKFWASWPPKFKQKEFFPLLES